MLTSELRNDIPIEHAPVFAHHARLVAMAVPLAKSSRPDGLYEDRRRFLDSGACDCRKGASLDPGQRVYTPGAGGCKGGRPRSLQVSARRSVSGGASVALAPLGVSSNFDALQGRATLRVAHGVIPPWAMPPAAATVRGRFVGLVILRGFRSGRRSWRSAPAIVRPPRAE